MSSPRTMNVHVPWTEVAELFELPLTSRSLPTQTRCPMCGTNQLRIYQDNITGGQWHHCGGCGSRGDMIRLAATAWELDVPQAIQKLATLGFPIHARYLHDEAITAYMDTQARYEDVLKLWNNSREYLALNSLPTITALMHRYHLNFNGSNERWRNGPGHLIGAYPRTDIERVYLPGSFAYQNTPPSSARLFKGRNWGDVMTMAYFDLPDRVCAMRYLGRHGDIPADEVVKATRRSPQVLCEAGLAGVQSVRLAGDPLYVVATDDWLLMLQLQMRHFNISTRPLPLVSWMDERRFRTRQAWQMLNEKKVVFWSPLMTCRMLRQAIMTDGMISCVGPDKPDIENVMSHYLGLQSSADLVRLIVKKAKPWHKALAAWMKRARDGQVENLLLKLEKAGEDVPYILRQCGKSPQSIDVPSAREVVQTEWGEVHNRGDRWVYYNYAGRRETLILDAVLQITHAIQDQRSNQLYYRGWVRFKGQQVFFLQQASEIERGVRWMRPFLAEHGLGLVQSSVKWSNRLYDLAVAFHEPEFLTAELSDVVADMRAKGELKDPL